LAHPKAVHKMSIYLNNTWKPIEHTIIKDADVRKTVHEKGFFIDEIEHLDVLNRLNQLYEETHQLKSEEGGMFYSVYSQDTAYRKHIFEECSKIFTPFLNEKFVDFKVVIYSFVVKLPGKKSEFYLHQDTTGLDETKHSPLSLWIPLQDVDKNNGCLGIIPKSHNFFSPYRSISFPAPFDHIQQKVKQYLQPLPMKKGEVLIFDNRILHHSFSNNSNQPRVALICGLFPKEAKFITCHKPEYKCGGKIELIEHNDDYLLTGKNFLIDCQKRPETGESLGWVEDLYPEISEKEFEEICRVNHLAKYSSITKELLDCSMIAEPKINEIKNEQNKGFLDKLKELITSK
jgi:hypothetical protein